MPVWLLPNGAQNVWLSPTAAGTWTNAITTTTTTAATNTIYYPIYRPTPTASVTAPTLYWTTIDHSHQWQCDEREFENLIIERRAMRAADLRREERQAQRELQQQIYAPAVHNRPRIDDAAKRRAHELLLDHLTPEQKEMFERQQWFIVEGGKTKKKYRIRGNGQSVVANIDVIEADKITHRLCGHCSPSEVPFGDQLLAQKLMLEFAEEDFLRIANRHPA